jgi:predicted anti-sigma-YlaC factor YlaD
MGCSLLREDLCAYADNELDAEGRARVEAHLNECEACAEEVGAFRVVKSLVSRLRLQEEAPPESLQVAPTSLHGAPRRERRSWLRRPVPGYAVALAAAAVLVALLVSWRHYESAFIGRAQQRDVIWAHLRTVSSICLHDPGAVRGISTRAALRGRGERPVALEEGAATVGARAALHTVYLVGDHAISQFRFGPGQFNTRNLSEQALGNQVYRVGRVGDYSIASCEEGAAQIVLVSSTSPEALLLLAQNILPERSFDPPDVGY